MLSCMCLALVPEDPPYHDSKWYMTGKPLIVIHSIYIYAIQGTHTTRLQCLVGWIHDCVPVFNRVEYVVSTRIEALVYKYHIKRGDLVILNQVVCKDRAHVGLETRPAVGSPIPQQ